MKRRLTTIMDDNFQNKVALVERNTSPGGVVLVNPQKTAKRTCNDLVQLAMEIEKADDFVHATASNKLQVIAQQVRFLKEQAQHVLEEARLNTSLHHAACNFVKVPGKVYHLYKRPTGQEYFSMLSPQEWNTPHQFLGSYRLEYDHSWTSVEDINNKDAELKLINKILQVETPNAIKFALNDTPMES